jgi:plasmid maintenance system antidote protein VapI
MSDYHERKMNSREQNFVESFFGVNNDWLYQPKTFRFHNTKYTPDFYDCNRGVYIEVVGTRQAFHSNKNKYELFKKARPDINFEVRDYSGDLYLYKESPNWTKLTNKIKDIDKKALSKKTGLSHTMIHYLLNGQRGIGRATAVKLSKASKRSAWWWLNATPEQVEREFAKLSKERTNGKQGSV